MANVTANEVSKTYAGTGASDALWGGNGVTYQINIGTGTVKLEGSVDGTNFVTLPLPDGTTASSWTAGTAGMLDPVPMWVRANCTAYTSGVSVVLIGKPGQEPLA